MAAMPPQAGDGSAAPTAPLLWPARRRRQTWSMIASSRPRICSFLPPKRGRSRPDFFAVCEEIEAVGEVVLGRRLELAGDRHRLAERGHQKAALRIAELRDDRRARVDADADAQRDRQGGAELLVEIVHHLQHGPRRQDALLGAGIRGTRQAEDRHQAVGHEGVDPPVMRLDGLRHLADEAVEEEHQVDREAACASAC